MIVEDVQELNGTKSAAKKRQENKTLHLKLLMIWASQPKQQKIKKREIWDS